jgi:hypothetical protein
MPRRKHHHVYVIELSKDVLFEPRFRKNNPDYRAGKPCVYVGMTGLYEAFNPMRYEDAVDKEIEVGIDLRSAGFGVWQA